jgi:hypothetical protein
LEHVVFAEEIAAVSLWNVTNLLTSGASAFDFRDVAKSIGPLQDGLSLQERSLLFVNHLNSVLKEKPDSAIPVFTKYLQSNVEELAGKLVQFLSLLCPLCHRVLNEIIGVILI